MGYAYLWRYSNSDTRVLLLLIMKPPRKRGGDCRQKCFPLGRADGTTYPERRRVPVVASMVVVVVIGHSFRFRSWQRTGW
jgi:hypothetical protein